MATGQGNLPYPISVVSAFDIILAQTTNEENANIGALADGTGLGDNSIPTSALQDGAAAYPKYPQLIQSGVSGTINIVSSGTGGNSVSITFPVAYANTPVVIASLNSGAADDVSVAVSARSTTGATFLARKSTGSTSTGTVNWIAIGT